MQCEVDRKGQLGNNTQIIELRVLSENLVPQELVWRQITRHITNRYSDYCHSDYHSRRCCGISCCDAQVSILVNIDFDDVFFNVHFVNHLFFNNYFLNTDFISDLCSGNFFISGLLVNNISFNNYFLDTDFVNNVGTLGYARY